MIIIGATNFPEALDKYVICTGLKNTHQSCWYESILVFSSALIRPGRFDMQVTVPKPDVKGRTEILNWYLKKIKVDPGVFFCFRFLQGFLKLGTT